MVFNVVKACAMACSLKRAKRKPCSLVRLDASPVSTTWIMCTSTQNRGAGHRATTTVKVGLLTNCFSDSVPLPVLFRSRFVREVRFLHVQPGRIPMIRPGKAVTCGIMCKNVRSRKRQQEKTTVTSTVACTCTRVQALACSSVSHSLLVPDSTECDK